MALQTSDTEFNVETLAAKTVDLLSVQPGQVIWIWASTHSLDLVEALAYRIRERGAVDSFWELLAASSGDKDAIAEFAVGLNPGVTEPVGDIALDEKIGGSVHIAIGMNDHFGGRNRSNLHLDLVIMRPTVWLDSEQAIVDGVLLA